MIVAARREVHPVLLKITAMHAAHKITDTPITEHQSGAAPSRRPDDQDH